MLLWMQTPDCQPSNILLTHPRKWVNVLLGVMLVVIFCTIPLNALAETFPGKGSKAKWEEAAKYSALGIQQANKGDFESAISSFNKAISTYNQDPAFYSNLGLVYRKTNQFNLAKSSYQKALNIDSSYGRGWINLGYLYDRLGENSKSIDCYNKAKLCKLSDKEQSDLNKAIELLASKNKRGHDKDQ